jgi:hypothetical protein
MDRSTGRVYRATAAPRAGRRARRYFAATVSTGFPAFTHPLMPSGIT